MAFIFATVPPQPTLLEAKGEVLDTDKLDKPHTHESVPDSADAINPPNTASDIAASALSSGGLATPEVTRGRGGQDIALVEADPFRSVPGLQTRDGVAAYVNSVVARDTRALKVRDPCSKARE